jgi:sec-independent protein translocase protein TatA
MPGMGELLIILVIVLLIFGAGKLPAIGDALGRSIKNFKRSAIHDSDLEISPKEKDHDALREGRSVEDADLLAGRGSETSSRERERV